MSTHVIIDGDPIVYQASFASQESYINVTHIPTGRKKEFKTKTAFFGHWKKKDGGWLGDLNQERTEKGLVPFSVDEFTIESGARLKSDESLPMTLHTTKCLIEAPVIDLQADGMSIHLGNSEPLWRWQVAQMMEYKGNRKDFVPPILKQEVKAYIKNKYRDNLTIAYKGVEADDTIVMEAYEKAKDGITPILSTIDKDAYGCGYRVYNPDHPELGVIDCSGFGELIQTPKKIWGYGLIWKIFQICTGDPTDNYKANAWSEFKWGDDIAYSWLKDAKTPKAAWTIAWDIFNTLYPETVRVQTWRGDDFVVTPLYCMQEMANMAHMWRFDKDIPFVPDILRGCGICLKS